MASQRLPKFTAARRAAHVYLRDSAKARDSQYEFLALAYLAHQEGMRCPRAYQTALEKRLGREPTGPEQKRHFLLLLHALLGTGDGVPRDVLPKISKMCTATEELSRAFYGMKPTRADLKLYIIHAGGIAGLWDMARLGQTEERPDSDDIRETPSSTLSVASLKPNDISLPTLGAHVTKAGRGYRLRLTNWEPGEHVVRIRVGNGGFIQAILDVEDQDEAAA